MSDFEEHNMGAYIHALKTERDKLRAEVERLRDVISNFARSLDERMKDYGSKSNDARYVLDGLGDELREACRSALPGTLFGR